MELQVRKAVSQKTKDTEVLHEHGIHPVFIDRCKVLRQQVGQFIFLQKRIHRKIQLYAVEMAVINGFQQIFRIRVLRIRAGSKEPAARIDCVRAGMNRAADSFQAPPGSQKLDPF